MVMAMIYMSILLSCGNTPTEDKTVVKHNLNLVEIIIPVEGMTCEGCENTVNQQLLKLQGLQSAQASHTLKQVRIKIDTNITSVEEVERNIEQVGYTVVK
jgi:copper chaperone CopZ